MQCKTVEEYVSLLQRTQHAAHVKFVETGGLQGRSLSLTQNVKHGCYLFGEFPLAVLEDSTSTDVDGSKLLNAIQFSLALENSAKGETLHASKSVIFDMCDPNATADVFDDATIEAFEDVRPEQCNLRLSCAQMNKVLRIYCANAHQIATESANNDGSKGCSGVFPMTALMNHSCEPNCGFSCGNTYASRDSMAGEELTISYLSAEDLAKPTVERQRILQEGFHFDCVCLKCARSQLNTRTEHTTGTKRKKTCI